MSTRTRPLVSRIGRALLVAALAAPAIVAWAQTTPQPGPPPADAAAAALDGRQNQKIEHIRVEDKNARVDEVRYGGQTQSITVQPKADVPAYEVLPNNGGRDRQGPAETASGGNGPRVWNVFKF